MERSLNEQPVKKTITIGQALMAVITLLGVIIGFYTQTQIRLHDLETRMTEKEKVDTRSEDQFNKINIKLDAMRLEMFDIKVELVKKADKK